MRHRLPLRRPAVLCPDISVRELDHRAVLRCSSRSGAIRTVDPSETRCGYRCRLLCESLRRCQLQKCMGPRLGAVPDGRRIATGFDRTGLFVVTVGIQRFAERAKVYKQRRKSNPQQGEAARWLLLVSCVGEPESSTTTSIPFWQTRRTQNPVAASGAI